ncbi:hypothetical protein, partial [Paenibacillus amylolyticus]|uniref:hypothetical protein n=1 Tax=Paenibacillus amylolyticus TaxID=1451 RepID=UPI001961E7D3
MSSTTFSHELNSFIDKKTAQSFELFLIFLNSLKKIKTTTELHRQWFFALLGGVLLSQDPAVQVPSALEGLT